VTLIILQRANERFERVPVIIELGMFDRLKDEYAAFEGEGKSRKLEVRSELASLFVNAWKRPLGGLRGNFSIYSAGPRPAR
jgi:hypothetical protein